MADGSVQFTVRLVNQVTKPAKAIQQAVRGVSKAFGEAQRVAATPASKRGVASDWDKMLAKAKNGQATDFARQQARLVKRQTQVTKHQKVMAKRMDQFHADHSIGAGIAEVTEGAAVDGVLGLAAAIAAATVAIGYLGLKFIETALEAGRFAESSTKAIGYLTDNAAHAGTVFDDVRHMAQRLGLDVESTVEGFQKLLAAQFTVGQAKGLIKMGADMRAIGASAEEVQRIIYAMSEIKSIGTLQKRQERMLQMAGISGELIDKALMKRTGIKDKAGIDKARKGGKIDADTAILAVQDAVMAKTHEKALGDTGATRAATQINGMLDVAKAGVENFWIDAGQKMQPGAVRIAKLIAGTIGKIVDDPKFAELGNFLLAKWEVFTNWVEARWPAIEATLIGGLRIVADSIMWVTDALTISDTKWNAITGVLWLTAGALAAVTIAGFLLMLPLLLLIGLVGLVIVALGLLTTWIVDQAKKWYDEGQNMVRGLVAGILSQLGPLGAAVALVASMTPGANKQGAMAPIPGMAQPYTEIKPDMPSQGLQASSGIGGALLALSGAGSGKTEGGQPSGGAAVRIGEMPIHVTAAAGEDPNTTGAKIGAAVRAELQKVFETHG
jgi:hypothetical protein